MVRLLGLFTIIPITIFLTISFFVLFALSKVNSKNLRNFGITIAILLWVSASLVLSVGIYTLVTGKHPMMRMHKAMMRDMMKHCGAMAPKGTMPAQDKMMMPGGLPRQQ